MSTIDIFYSKYYDFESSTLVIGGVETYITNLCNLITELGHKVRIIQFSDKDQSIQLSDSIKILGLRISDDSRKYNNLYYRAASFREKGRYCSLFATDTMIPTFRVQNSIAIQHGIYWDIPYEVNQGGMRAFLGKCVTSWSIIRRTFNVDLVVCVDNNYICWFRSMMPYYSEKLKPILNFTAIGRSLPYQQRDNNLRIVFARRFCKYRGTHLFADAVDFLLKKYTNLDITFAGTGPEANYLHNRFNGVSNVHFTQYSSSESLNFHSQFDIAVVPTIGSEGTSLSLLEAMSSHCAVVCTNIGGMTNIALDEYNALMISPNVSELIDALSRLIEDEHLRTTIANRAYETVSVSFSLEKWKKEWTKVFKDKL